ncbi:MAG: MBL fold metallo-hydrolase [Anaerolineales bacterium]|nr:MBL fold metallo-hydrolase [Anaerolineales bacterium]
MAEIVVLGSGCGLGTGSRFSTTVALLANERCYLLDCAEPAAVSLFKNGIDPLSVRAIMVSHLHPDHVGGLASVLFSMYLPGRSSKKKFKPWSITRYDDWYRRGLTFPVNVPEEGDDWQVDIFLPSEGVAGIETYLKTVYLDPELLPFGLRLNPVETGVFYRDDQIACSAINNLHMANNFRYDEYKKTRPKVLLQSYSFKVQVEDKTLVYSGDIDDINELAPFMDGVDVLMVEVAHYDPGRIKLFIDNYPIGRVILLHIHTGLETRIADLVKAWDDPRITIAYDSFRTEI